MLLIWIVFVVINDVFLFIKKEIIEVIFFGWFNWFNRMLFFYDVNIFGLVVLICVWNGVLIVFGDIVFMWIFVGVSFLVSVWVNVLIVVFDML